MPISDIARGHVSCVLDGLTTMNKFSAPRIIRYSMPKQARKTNLLVYCINTTKQNFFEFSVCHAVKQKLKLLATRSLS